MNMEVQKPLEESYTLWTDNCHLKPQLDNIKETLVTYRHQYYRRLKDDPKVLENLITSQSFEH